MSGFKSIIGFALLVIFSIFQGTLCRCGNVCAQVSTAAPGSPTVKTMATRLRGFGIPFNINSDDDAFIEVQLYLSQDQGKTWQFLSRQTTDQSEIPFQAKQDGEYWFALKTLNRDRRLIPEGDPQPELKIIVDTVQPRLDFRIGTDAAGRVICRWKAEDENLDPRSLKILYQAIAVDGASSPWHHVPVEFNASAASGVYSDQIAWWPETNEQALNVVIEVADTAGNRVQLDRQIVVPETAWRHRAESTTQIAQRPVINDPASNWAQPDTSPRPRLRDTPDLPEINDPASDKMAQAPTLPINHDGSHDLPPNVVCEDGVCRVLPAASVNQVPTSAATRANPNVRLVGSKLEYAAPPVPVGYVAVQMPAVHAVEARKPGRQPPPRSIEWKSESEEWGSQIQANSSSTMQVDPSIAPEPSSTFQRRFVTDVPSNPPTTSIQGDYSVGQSSTQGATNQYRSPDSQRSRGIVDATLLPGVPQSDSKFTDSKFLNTAYSNRRPQGQQSVLKTPITNTRSNASTQFIGSKRFQLNYGIDSIDPSGVARVELWVTRDQGRTWNAWGVDPNNRSPFPVEVEEEGHFGFRIVVHSKDGLTGKGPASGDDADMWIEVDTQAPLTRITSVPYGRGNEAGRLVINYSVVDPFLTLRPITLAYSPAKNGPWTLIEEGVRNEGRYVWKVGTHIPQDVYLRIEAIDEAGNVGIHSLGQPIDVSGLVPRGTIHGVVPVGRRSPGG